MAASYKNCEKMMKYIYHCMLTHLKICVLAYRTFLRQELWFCDLASIGFITIFLSRADILFSVVAPILKKKGTPVCICYFGMTEVNQSPELYPEIFLSLIYKYKDFLEWGFSRVKSWFPKISHSTKIIA